MKKFLSLLLAMTMVMSLIVLPARAAGETPTTPTAAQATGTTISPETLTLEKGAGTNNTLTVTTTGAKVGEASCTVATESPYTWRSSDETVATVSNNNDGTATITALMAGTTTITCKVAYTYTDSTGSASKPAEQTVSCRVTVTDSFKAAITGITYNGRPCVISGNNLTYYTISSENGTAQWSVTAASEYGTPTASLSGNVLTVTGANSVTTTYNATAEAATVTLGTPTPSTISKDGTTSITATVKGFTPVQYTWAYTKDSDATVHAIPNQATSTLTWTPGTAGTYKVTCTATYKQPSSAEANDGVSVTSSETTITVENKTYAFAGSTAIYVNKNGTKYVDAKLYPVPVVSSTAVNDARYTYTVSPSTPNVVTVASNGLITVQNSGYANVTVSSNYKGKPYNYNVVIYASALSADLTRQVYYGNPVSYTYSDLIEAADKALSGSYGYGSYYGKVTTIDSAYVTSGVDVSRLGTFTGSISRNVGTIYATASYSGRGKAPITATVTTSTGQPVTVTLNIPVVPIPTTFDSLTAEPVTSSYNSAVTSYRVNFPSTYSTYYVIQKNGSTVPDYAAASLGTAYSASTPYTLTSADFTNGQCTLYVIATNNYTYGSSYGTYYSGAITVTQTNHDIKYNGVVGGTVQFKHNDFTTFMNEMYGTNTTSYLTFNSVKFTSVPNATTQGTLYYNGSAMTTGYGSNYFNTSTAVTNLDNVSFSVSSRVPSTTKEIRIPFTLYATRYNSYGTSAGTSVTYSGVVVISLVREDVTFTVAPGDSVRFTDSAFLTYLRSASGINYNYNIDYVTFDQSAVNALNEGVLYAYSTGFNAVKTTDRFYYTTTSYNQNALSDVTFRASTYAKTGTTVYIPFTIYAKYGTSSATRQVTGTVAIKIAQTMNFVDVKTSDYFYDSVKWAVNNNITKGTSATTFSPNNTCTRAEIVTFLWRAAGSPTPTITRNPFTDVKYPVGSDFYNAILWASQNGITAGKTTTTFAPNDNCTRAQIVTFLWRYAKKPLGYYTNPFNDVNKTEYAAYYDAILWAAGKGISTGNTPKTFDPDGTCTRAEAVTFLYRYESTK